MENTDFGEKTLQNKIWKNKQTKKRLYFLGPYKPTKHSLLSSQQQID